MQFVAKKQNILNEISLVQGIVEKRSTRPILANTLLETDDNSIKVYATDLEVGLSSNFEAVIGTAGSITSPARKLADIVRLLPEDVEISVEVTENNYLRITCGKIEYKLAGAPKADFPSVPKYDFADGIKIPAQTLKEMINRTIYAITTEETRYALNGAQLSFEAGKIRMVSTDAHRLSFVEYPFKEYEGEPMDILVPRKTVAELRTLIGEKPENVEFGHSENHLFFRVGGRTLDSRMLEGQFPNYEKVIPKGNDKRVTINREVLAEAINRVALLSHETSRAVRLQFMPGSMLLSSSNPEMGEAKEEIEAIYDGTDMHIGFNAKYLSEFISSLDSDEVIMELRDEAGAGLMLPAGEDKGIYKYVIMPMRI
ncbi:MAG TPA: DNA polymerase III subunit beta [Acidobacteriota bacterium]|nr:DNA polymerase III subunit beta [Acidobacteriota bacterium]